MNQFGPSMCKLTSRIRTTSLQGTTDIDPNLSVCSEVTLKCENSNGGKSIMVPYLSTSPCSGTMVISTSTELALDVNSLGTISGFSPGEMVGTLREKRGEREGERKGGREGGREGRDRRERERERERGREVEGGRERGEEEGEKGVRREEGIGNEERRDEGEREGRRGERVGRKERGREERDESEEWVRECGKGERRESSADEHTL